MRPNVLLVRACLARGAMLWFTTRLIVSAAFMLVGVNPMRISAATAIALVALTGAMSVLETHRRGERALLGNLGVRPSLLVTMSAGPALLGEVILAVAGAAIP